MLLMQQLLPAIRISSASNTFVFQQHSAVAHRATDRIRLFHRETPQFIVPNMWPPNSLDLNPVDRCTWGYMQERVYKTPVHDTDELVYRLIQNWAAVTREFKSREAAQRQTTM